MIETRRLILRPFQEEDAADVFEYLEKPMVNSPDGNLVYENTIQWAILKKEWDVQ